MAQTGQCQCLNDSENQTQEIAVQMSGGSAENQLSGVLINRIPKTGGNTFSSEEKVLFSNGSMQAENLDDELRGAASRRRRSSTANTTSTTAWAAPSSRTGSGSTLRAGTGPTTASSRMPSIPTAARPPPTTRSGRFRSG